MFQPKKLLPPLQSSSDDFNEYLANLTSSDDSVVSLAIFYFRTCIELIGSTHFQYFYPLLSHLDSNIFINALDLISNLHLSSHLSFNDNVFILKSLFEIILQNTSDYAYSLVLSGILGFLTKDPNLFDPISDVSSTLLNFFSFSDSEITDVQLSHISMILQIFQIQELRVVTRNVWLISLVKLINLPHFINVGLCLFDSLYYFLLEATSEEINTLFNEQLLSWFKYLLSESKLGIKVSLKILIVLSSNSSSDACLIFLPSLLELIDDNNSSTIKSALCCILRNFSSDDNQFIIQFVNNEKVLNFLFDCLTKEKYAISQNAFIAISSLISHFGKSFVDIVFQNIPNFIEIIVSFFSSSDEDVLYSSICAIHTILSMYYNSVDFDEIIKSLPPDLFEEMFESASHISDVDVQILQILDDVNKMIQ